MDKKEFEKIKKTISVPIFCGAWDEFTSKTTCQSIMDTISTAIGCIEKHEKPDHNLGEALLTDLSNAIIILLRNDKAAKLGLLGNIKIENNQIIIEPSEELSTIFSLK